MKIEDITHLKESVGDNPMIWMTCYSVRGSRLHGSFLTYALGRREANDIVRNIDPIRYTRLYSITLPEYLGSDIEFYEDDLKKLMPELKKHRYYHWEEGT